MNSATKLVPFPLFHGSSNHYLSSFKLGSTPVAWSHKDTALRLLREVWDDLDRLRDQVATDAQEKLHWDITHGRVPWFVQRVIDQSSSFSSNWQHGELYLTPSKRTAVIPIRSDYAANYMTSPPSVIPAKAGIQRVRSARIRRH